MLNIPQGYVDSHSTLPWVTWEAVTGVECIHFSGLLRHTLTNGALSTQTKVEGFVLKAVWHWVSNRSVVNDPLGEPGRTPLYVVLPSAWGSVDGDRMFSPHFVGGLILGTPTVINERLNKPLALETELLSP